LNIFQSACPSDGFAESMTDDIMAPIDLPLSSESADLLSTETISMSFDGALLKDVLLLFSQQSGLNFVASQEAESKKVTVRFEVSGILSQGNGENKGKKCLVLIDIP
jgi:type II secretory pathway component GspD/PulD (secretin)